jgi:hypothetical protein
MCWKHSPDGIDLLMEMIIDIVNCVPSNMLKHKEHIL